MTPIVGIIATNFIMAVIGSSPKEVMIQFILLGHMVEQIHPIGQWE